MGKLLSRSEIDAYWSNGFVFPIDVLTESEAASARRRLEEVERRFGPMHYFVKPHLVMQVADELAHHPRLLDAVEDLIGPDILAWTAPSSSRNRGRQARLLAPGPYLFRTRLGPGRGVHLARPVAGHGRERRHADDPRQPPPRSGRASNDGRFVERPLRRQTLARDVDETSAVDVVLRPGQMSIHHGLVFHSSSPNRSADRRIGFNMNLIQPSVRQVALASDSAMLLRGQDRFGHYRPEPRPTRTSAMPQWRCGRR